jgi:hypothetical protein
VKRSDLFGCVHPKVAWWFLGRWSRRNVAKLLVVRRLSRFFVRCAALVRPSDPSRKGVVGCRRGVVETRTSCGGGELAEGLLRRGC